jgi:hypothetical protein
MTGYRTVTISKVTYSCNVTHVFTVSCRLRFQSAGYFVSREVSYARELNHLFS